MARHRGLPALVAVLLWAGTVALLPGHGQTSGWSVPFSPTLPPPTGEHPVGVRHHVVTTTSVDPWDQPEARSVMLDLHYPAEADEHPLSDYYRANYMSELAMLRWRAGVEGRTGLPVDAVNWAFRVHSHEWAPPAEQPMPVVLLSAPPGSMRTQYTQLAEELASHGFLVVTVDHPHDAPVVELFPTREVVIDDRLSEVPRSVVDRLRVDDIEYVIRNLERVDPELAPYVASTQVGLIGWLGDPVGHTRRLVGLPSVRAVVALRPFTLVTGGRDPRLLALRSTSLATLSDDALLVAQFADHVPGFEGSVPPSARERRARAVARVRAHFLRHLRIDDGSAIPARSQSA